VAKTVDRGEPSSYLTLVEGIPVYTLDGVALGKVTRVLADIDKDVFDGLVITTRDGERFVDAPRVREIYERAVVLAVTAEEAQRLPGPPPVPPVIEVGREEWVRRPSEPEEPPKPALRRAWERVFGRR
jgi:sporulation protein YlmC with PRC-barrel domain